MSGIWRLCERMREREDPKDKPKVGTKDVAKATKDMVKAEREAKAEETKPTVKLFGKIATIKSRMRMVTPP